MHVSKSKSDPYSRSVRAKSASDILGIGVSTFWRWVKERPDMPQGILLSPRCRVFDLRELIEWRDAHQQEK